MKDIDELNWFQTSVVDFWPLSCFSGGSDRVIIIIFIIPLPV